MLLNTVMRCLTGKDVGRMGLTQDTPSRWAAALLPGESSLSWVLVILGEKVLAAGYPLPQREWLGELSLSSCQYLSESWKAEAGVLPPIVNVPSIYFLPWTALWGHPCRHLGEKCHHCRASWLAHLQGLCVVKCIQLGKPARERLIRQLQEDAAKYSPV